MSDTNEITVTAFDIICDTAIGLKREINRLKDEQEEKQKELTAYERQIEGYLDEFGKTDWKSGSGNIELRTRTSCKVPRDQEAKKALFAWLQARGGEELLYSSININSNTLNALYKSEHEAASQEGRDFTLPGVEAPTEYTTVIIKPK